MLEAKSLYGVVCAYSVVSDSLRPPWTIDLQAPLSMEFSRKEIPEWVAISFSRRSSGPRDQTCVSCISCLGRGILYHLCHLGISPSNLYAEALPPPPVRLYLQMGPLRKLLRLSEVIRWGLDPKGLISLYELPENASPSHLSLSPHAHGKERPCEHKARRHVSAVQGESFHQTPISNLTLDC